MILMRRVKYEELNKNMAVLVDRFLGMRNSNGLQEAMEKLEEQMYSSDHIGVILHRGRTIVKNRVMHLGSNNWPTVVCTKDWRTGWTIFHGRRTWIHFKTYGSYWMTRRQMKEFGLTSEDLLRVPDISWKKEPT